MAYRKWQKKKIGLSIEELTEQEEYVLGSGSISRTNLGRVRPSLSLYPSSLWSKQISIEDGNVLKEAENLITSQVLAENISTTKDALLYFKFRGGHLSVGVTNGNVGSLIYGFGIGFRWEGVVKDGVTISSLLYGPVDTRVNLTTLSDLPTTFHEFVMHVDRLRKKCVLYNVNTSAKLGEINIDGAQDVVGNPETTPKIFAYVLTGGTPETPYVRACKPNIIAIGDSITYRGTDIYPWYDYVKQLGLNLRTQGHKNWFVVNKGIGSQTSAAIDARIASDVVAHEPNYCFLQASDNDYGVVDYTTRNSNINSSISTLETAGITVLLTNSIVPNSNHVYYPEIATYFKTWNADHFNNTVFPNADYLIDIMAPVADPNGDLDPTYADDGIHPNIAGYGLIGDSVAEQMCEWNPHSDTMNSGRKAYYEKDLYSELSAEELADEVPTGDIGCVNWNPTDGVQSIEIINEDSGGIEIGSIKIDMTKPFWGDSYIDLDEMIFYDHGGFEEVTVSSGAATLSANGTGTCYLVDSSGAFYFGTISGDTVTTNAPDGDYTVIYELETPLESNVIAASTFKVSSTSNGIQIKTYRKASFDTDGYTTVFNTSFVPATVLLNGLDVTSEVTLGASSVTFSTAPRRKQLLEVESAKTLSAALLLEATVFDASGSVETVPALVDLTVTENEEKTGYINVDGAALKVAGNKTYTVTVNKDLIESQGNILEEYRDKKFRLKVENPRDSSTEYLGVCHIDPEASLDYLNGTESITIKCGDLYD